VVEVDGTTVGIAGSKGFGGGFVGACASDFGEPEMKAFVRHTKTIAGNLQRGLAELDSEVRVALLHFSPVEDTLVGERWRSTPSSAAICWPKPSTPWVPTWCCMAMSTAAARRAPPSAVCPCATWPSP